MPIDFQNLEIDIGEELNFATKYVKETWLRSNSYTDICNYICLDKSYNFLALSLLLKYSLSFQVLTSSIDVVLVLSTELEICHQCLSQNLKYGAVSDDKFIKMMTCPFSCIWSPQPLCCSKETCYDTAPFKWLAVDDLRIYWGKMTCILGELTNVIR